jgi:hypothetical protein
MVFLTSNKGGNILNPDIQYTYENALMLLYGLRNPGIDALERQSL